MGETNIVPTVLQSWQRGGMRNLYVCPNDGAGNTAQALMGRVRYPEEEGVAVDWVRAPRKVRL